MAAPCGLQVLLRFAEEAQLQAPDGTVRVETRQAVHLAIVHAAPQLLSDEIFRLGSVGVLDEPRVLGAEGQLSRQRFLLGVARSGRHAASLAKRLTTILLRVV